ncbi:UxaA family hydrolase [Mycobacterium sp. ITM-2016-00317]|uniref:UxaA family hydrolase n=1 Tax=Mycobacterium sp. ITM-2016-00317 TaxID=2099694 RepID=UPI000D45BD8E|nr:UxaA family hydrolase [Mycobacterium sp. ITM-2016-00317]WNG87538.1 UxaA family hydrolase [Mycobacterium sp. ITM-2016-00317]
MRLIILDARDNVATAAEDMQAGATGATGTDSVVLLDDVPHGHKVALADIANGADVIRYGEIIGAATADIVAGRHVHVHNLISKRIPGDGR